MPVIPVATGSSNQNSPSGPRRAVVNVIINNAADSAKESRGFWGQSEMVFSWFPPGCNRNAEAKEEEEKDRGYAIHGVELWIFLTAVAA